MTRMMGNKIRASLIAYRSLPEETMGLVVRRRCPGKQSDWLGSCCLSFGSPDVPPIRFNGCQQLPILQYQQPTTARLHGRAIYETAMAWHLQKRNSNGHGINETSMVNKITINHRRSGFNNQPPMMQIRII